MKYLMILLKLTLLLTVTTGWAQQQPAAAAATPPSVLECQVLTGRVTDPFAYPLTGATIMLRSPDKGFSPEAFVRGASAPNRIQTRAAKFGAKAPPTRDR